MKNVAVDEGNAYVPDFRRLLRRYGVNFHPNVPGIGTVTSHGAVRMVANIIHPSGGSLQSERAFETAIKYENTYISFSENSPLVVASCSSDYGALINDWHDDPPGGNNLGVSSRTVRSVEPLAGLIGMSLLGSAYAGHRRLFMFSVEGWKLKDTIAFSKRANSLGEHNIVEFGPVCGDEVMIIDGDKAAYGKGHRYYHHSEQEQIDARTWATGNGVPVPTEDMKETVCEWKLTTPEGMDGSYESNRNLNNVIIDASPDDMEWFASTMIPRRYDRQARPTPFQSLMTSCRKMPISAKRIIDNGGTVRVNNCGSAAVTPTISKILEMFPEPFFNILGHSHFLTDSKHPHANVFTEDDESIDHRGEYLKYFGKGSRLDNIAAVPRHGEGAASLEIVRDRSVSNPVIDDWIGKMCEKGLIVIVRESPIVTVRYGRVDRPKSYYVIPIIGVTGRVGDDDDISNLSKGDGAVIRLSGSKRPFAVPGSGMRGHHFTGDVFSNYGGSRLLDLGGSPVRDVMSDLNAELGLCECDEEQEKEFHRR